MLKQPVQLSLRAADNGYNVNAQNQNDSDPTKRNHNLVALDLDGAKKLLHDLVDSITDGAETSMGVATPAPVAPAK